MPGKMSRRDFLFTGGKIIAGASLGYLNSTKTTEATKLVGNSAIIESLDDLIKMFKTAPSGPLMFIYSNFFYYLRNSKGNQLPTLLQKKINEMNDDNHRLKALPAVAAIHRLPEILTNEKRDEFYQLIFNTFTDPRREVKEIVLQNFLTSLQPNHDNMFNYHFPEQLLSIGDLFMDEVKESSKYLMAFSIYVQYLLTARTILLQKDPENEDSKHIENFLQKQFTQKLPEHFWYIQRLVELYQQLDKPQSNNSLCLPPQISESLMGWRNLYPYFEDIIKLFSMIRTRNFYMNFLTAIGKDTKNQKILSQSRAQTVVESTVAAHRIYGHSQLTQLWQSDLPDHIDKNFQKFMKTEFLEISDNLSLPPKYVSHGEHELAKFVPFSQYHEKMEPSYIAYRFHKKTKFDIAGLITAFLTGYGFVQAIDDVTKPFSIEKNSMDDKDKKINEDVKKKAEELAVKSEDIAERIENASGDHWDEMDQSLGIPKFHNFMNHIRI